jgi:hypothetical protein
MICLPLELAGQAFGGLDQLDDIEAMIDSVVLIKPF